MVVSMVAWMGFLMVASTENCMVDKKVVQKDLETVVQWVDSLVFLMVGRMVSGKADELVVR